MKVISQMISHYSPKTRSGRILAGAAAVDSIGSGLFLAILPVFLVTQIGVNPVDVGIVVGVANFVGLAAPVIAGMCADRFGAGRVWVILLLSRSIGYACFLLVDSLQWYAVLACALSLLDRGSTPVQQAFVVQVEPSIERTRSMAMLRTVRNAGLSVGLLLSGIVLSIGEHTLFLAAFAVNACSYLVPALAVRSIDRKPRVKPHSSLSSNTTHSPQRTRLRYGEVWRDRPYLLLTIGDMLVSVHDSVLLTLLPLWIVTRTDIPSAAIGPLMAVNTILTVLLQIPISRFATGISNSRKLAIAALVPLVVSCVIFAIAEGQQAILATIFSIVSMLVLTVGENMNAVAGFELSHRLAPEKTIGSYLGVFNLGWSTQLTLGPPFMTVIALRGTVGWGAIATVYSAGTLAMALAAKRAEDGRSTSG